MANWLWKKSLCFQFPALITKKLTIALTPTISLTEDQVSSLQSKLGHPCFTPWVYTYVEMLLRNGEYDIIYATPKTFFLLLLLLLFLFMCFFFFLRNSMDPSTLFNDLICSGQVGLIAVDEAHLIYSNTFR